MERRNEAVDIIPKSVVSNDLEFSMCEENIGSGRTNVSPNEKSISSNYSVPQVENQNEVDDVVVRVRSLTSLQILITLVFAFGISAAFYYEIPEFAKALTGR